METTGKIQKFNFGYFLLTAISPILVLVLGAVIGVQLPESAGVIVCIIAFALPVLWWALLSRKVYEKKKDAKLAGLEAQGFTRNHTFDADGCTVVVDLVHGQVALLFRWNPGTVYIRPATALTNVRVDDGRGGVGILEGSSRVSFLFTVEGIRVRVNTFTSNKRWRMDSDYILTGISKADVMVEALTAAGAQAAR